MVSRAIARQDKQELLIPDTINDMESYYRERDYGLGILHTWLSMELKLSYVMSDFEMQTQCPLSYVPHILIRY